VFMRVSGSVCDSCSLVPTYTGEQGNEHLYLKGSPFLPLPPRRMLLMTPRVRAVLEHRWERTGKPIEGWVWPAQTRSGHLEPSSLRKQHGKTFETIAEQASKDNLKPVSSFVLYSLRHTFLTRLGESGCDAWTLARIAGHSTISISSRYVHPSDDAVLTAMSRLGGHKIGHTQNDAPQLLVATESTTAVQ